MKRTFTLLLLIIAISNSHAQTWSAMGNGLGSSAEMVKAVVVNQVSGDVIAGGTFTGSFNHIAKWNGSSWESIGDVNGPVYALGIRNQELFVGGLFTSAGGVTVSNFAKYSNNVWSDVGGGFNDQVNCIYVSSSTGSVYAGGKFTMSGTSALNHIAKLVSTTWTQVGAGISTNNVNCMAEYNTTLYAGCDLLSDPVQKFDGSSWSSVGGISGGAVYALASYANFLYAGGEFSSPTFAAAKYNGTTWATIQTTFGFSDKIYALFATSQLLFIGGKFTNLGAPIAASYAARITSATNPISSLTTPTSILNGDVYAIGYKSSVIYVGGKFTSPDLNVAYAPTTINVDELSDLVTNKTFYPNPVIKQAHLKIATKERLVNPELKIFDLQSRLVTDIATIAKHSSNEIEFIIDCGNLSAGNYYYLLTEEGVGVTTDKFVVE